MTPIPLDQRASHFGFAVLVLAAAIALELLVQQPAGMRFPGLLYTAIVAIAWYGGLRPALITLGAGALAAWWLLRRASANPGDSMSEALVVFVVVTCMTVSIALALRRMRAQRNALVERLASAERDAADAKHAADALSQRLSAQAEWHAMTLRSIGDAVITADPADRVLTMNPIAEALTGWRAGEAHGAPIERIFHLVGNASSDPSARSEPEPPAVCADVEGRGQALLQARDGAARFVRFTSVPIVLPGGQRFGRALTFVDITSDREAEAMQRQLAEAARDAERAARDALVESQAANERFSAFMAHFPYPAFIQDERGEFVFLNSAGQASAAWREVAARVPGERMTHVMSESVAMAGNDRHYFSIRFPIVMDGKTWLGGIAIDMTERARAERALSERTAEFQTLFENVPAPLWIARDTAAGQMVGNPAANMLVGAADEGPSDRTGWRFFEGDRLCSPDELPIAECMRERRIVQGTDLELESTDGGRRIVRMTAAPLLDGVGRVRGAVAAALDITQLKQYEAELERAVRRRDEFLAVLAHELRNPLVPIRNCAQLLSRAPEDVERARRGGATIERHAARMVRLIGDLLDVARISQGLVELDLARHPIHTIIESAIETLGTTAERTSHSIEVRHEDPQAELMVDALRAEQIVVNVLSNAIKYSPPGSEVRVRTSVDERFGRIEITDEGRGIATEHLGEIFRMFARPGIGDRQRVSGLGVGLALAKQLAEQQGGSIEAASEGRDRGATFTVTLPRASAANDTSVPDSSATRVPTA